MRINHNIAALNTYRQLSTNNLMSAKSLEKLSSGLRINRAADDAAGLAISEKMRAQIMGLNQAARNAQDGISLIQTAEGALNETHSILQRMRELAVQASNGTLTDEDRQAIRDEVQQLKSEIDRIANTTEFNTKKLLNGALAGMGGDEAVAVSGAAVFKGIRGTLTGVDVSSQDASSLDHTKVDALIIDGKRVDIAWSKYLTEDDITFLKRDFSSTTMTDNDGKKIASILERVINQASADAGVSAEVKVTYSSSSSGAFTIESQTKGTASRVELYIGDGGTALLADGATDVVGSNSVFDLFLGAGAEMAGSVTITAGDWQVINPVNNNDTFTVVYNGQRFQAKITSAVAAGSSASNLANAVQTAINNAVQQWNTSAGLNEGDEGYLKDVIVRVTSDGRLAIEAPSGSLELYEDLGKTVLEDIGLSSTVTSEMGMGAVIFQIGANKGQTLGLSIADMRASALGVAGIDVSTPTGAQSALTYIDRAIEKVSSERSKLGAIQNRLEHTINNLSTASENLTAAESRIRDVDMAKEMMEFTKMSILQQAASAMLAQANQQPQLVLQLLR